MFSTLRRLAFLHLFVFVLHVSASSPRPRPIKRLDHPASVSLHILPRQQSLTHKLSAREEPALDTDPRLRHSDSIRISLNAFDDIFHLHVTPNDDLLHPAARIKYYKTTEDGQSVLDRVEPILRQNVLVYGGKVFHDASTHEVLTEASAGGVWRPQGVRAPGERGWARIMVLDGGDPTTGRPPVFEGAFSVDGVIHHVSTKDNYLKTKLDLDPHPLEDTDLVIFRDSDIATVEEEEILVSGKPLNKDNKPKRPPTTCSHDRLGYNVRKDNPVLRWGAGQDRSPQETWINPLDIFRDRTPGEPRATNSSIIRRQDDINNAGDDISSNFIETIGSTAGCPMTQNIVYTGVAADCTYVQNNGGSANATQQILRNFNTVSLLYKDTFNVSVGITELQIQDGGCPTNDPANPWNVPCTSVSLNERLSLFSAWRGQKFANLNGATDPAGLFHLMSGCPSGTEVGVAWLGTICMKQASGQAPTVVSGTAVSTGGRTEWQVVAHEIGHNFGAIHDCVDGCNLSDDCCPAAANSCNSNSRFLMSPVSSASEQVFSPCTIGNVCSLMLGNNIDMSCIAPPNPAQQTFSLQMCGNGIVEDGEECDPGAGSESACCDSSTCKFLPGAVCDPSSSACCTTTCQFAASNTICRPSRNAICDKAELCSGTSAACPADEITPNGQECGSDGLACAGGICTSVSQQCRALGTSLGLKEACPKSDDNCQVSCQNPRNALECIILNSQLVEGSPCGYGGTCAAGKCKPGTILQTAIAWYKQNLQIAIPVSVAVGLLVICFLFCLLRCMFRCCCGSKSPKPPKPAAGPIPSGVQGQRITSWPAPAPAPGAARQNSLGLREAPPPGAPGPYPRLSGGGDDRPSSRISNRSGPVVPTIANIHPQPIRAPQPRYPSPQGGPDVGRQDSWGSNRSGNAGRPLIQDQQLRNDRTGWVDEGMYNGPRRS